MDFLLASQGVAVILEIAILVLAVGSVVEVHCKRSWRWFFTIGNLIGLLIPEFGVLSKLLVFPINSILLRVIIILRIVEVVRIVTEIILLVLLIQSSRLRCSWSCGLRCNWSFSVPTVSMSALSASLRMSFRVYRRCMAFSEEVLR